MGQILSTEILENLEHRLRAVGAPEASGASPGLSVEEIHAATAAIPHTVPSEAELWWSWRTWGVGDMLPDARYVTLKDCMRVYHERRRWAREYGVTPELPGVTADDWWNPLWLPIFIIDGGIVKVIDISASNGRSAPIRRIDSQGFGTEDFDPVVAPSLGQYLTDTFEAIDAGDYTYDTDGHYWKSHLVAG